MLKATIGTLLTLLVVIIAVSYYSNQEAFKDIDIIAKVTIPNATKATDTTKAKAVLTPADVMKAMGTDPVNQNAKQNVNAANLIIPVKTANPTTTPMSTELTPQVTLTDTGYDAMALNKQSNLVQDIQMIVHNELLSSRMTDVSVKNREDDSCEDTDCSAQGKEYTKGCPKDCSSDSHIDMTKYIKKDEIPCWGCSIDY